MMTPNTWDPRSDTYAKNEEAMLDWEGNMVPVKHRPVRMVIDELLDGDADESD